MLERNFEIVSFLAIMEVKMATISRPIPKNQFHLNNRQQSLTKQPKTAPANHVQPEHKEKETLKVDYSNTTASSSQSAHSIRSRRKVKKSIFISYSPDAAFTERKFVVETVKQLKDNNLAEDIWFDKDENNTDSPCWFSFRMEAVEKCRAAVLCISDSYLACPVSLYESKALLERLKNDSNSVQLFTIVYNNSTSSINSDISNQLNNSGVTTSNAASESAKLVKQLTKSSVTVVDLTEDHIYKLSLAEKTSIVIGGLMTELDKIASIHAPPQPPTPPDTEFTGNYKHKKICQWSANDLQEWLYQLGIKEFYRQSLAENMIDGFLLMSMTDQDMIQHIGIDSRPVRKKIMTQILATLDKEHKLKDNWHLRARTQKSKECTVYMVYDPQDVRLAQNLKHDLVQRNIQVIHHHKLGQSKQEFLSLNGPLMAGSTHVLIVMSEAATSSPFVFHELLFADWLGKKLVTAVFKNQWKKLRPALRAVIGECPAIDFESRMYDECLDILLYHVRPVRSVPGVVLEQAYLEKMTEGLKPLAALTNQSEKGETAAAAEDTAQVFMSYQWDMQSRVEDIKRILLMQGIRCWVDISSTMATSSTNASSHLHYNHHFHQSQPSATAASRNKLVHSGLSSQRSSLNNHSLHHHHHHYIDMATDSLQSHIQRTMKAAGVVLCCITPKYMQSDNCVKDLTLAETYHKPIVPVMMRFCPWPPEGAPSQVRKILVKHTPIDLSNEKLFKQNVFLLIDRLKKILGTK